MNHRICQSTPLIDPSSIRWINKRKPKGQTHLPGYILPNLSKQLSEIFVNLDDDQSGTVDIDELKKAVKLATAKSGSGKMETLEVVKFFSSMDDDNNGEVDFNEFVATIARSGTQNTSKASDLRLRNEFYVFTNQVKRQNIISKLDSQKPLTDIEKFNNMKRLFEIDHFVNEKLSHAMEEQNNVSRSIDKIYVDQKLLERKRSNDAAKYLRKTIIDPLLPQKQPHHRHTLPPLTRGLGVALEPLQSNNLLDSVSLASGSGGKLITRNGAKVNRHSTGGSTGGTSSLDGSKGGSTLLQHRRPHQITPL